MANMNCVKCGQKVNVRFNYCPACGSELVSELSSRMSTQGRITLPVKVRDKLKLKDGNYVVFELTPDNENYIIKKQD